MEEWTEISGIFDSHAHYDDAAFDADRTEVLNTLPQKGISYVMNVASDFMSAQAGISLTEQASLKETVKVEYYDLSGACLSTPHHGVNLVKKFDADRHATVKKVVF